LLIILREELLDYMASFETTVTDITGQGRCGYISTPHGNVQTPAFFPVLNLIGGPTPQSGGIWSRTRNRLFASDEFQGAMFQAMSFLDFNLKPHQLEKWRTKTLHEWFTDRDRRDDHAEYPADFTQPLFVDSGGFKLLNSRMFGENKNSGSENEWDIYTTPESILDLQLAYGADIVATLDYPIPPNLQKNEAMQRMRDSIDNAVECLQLLDDREEDPAVYVAIHGHDYDMINWYVGRFLDRIDQLDNIETSFEGFAVGSLVPLRDDVETLVDIVQGAKDAIPENRRDDLGLHVFGVGGQFCSLLALLGVDSFDSSTYVRAAQYKKFIDHRSWEKIKTGNLPKDWECPCEACDLLRSIGIDTMNDVLESGTSYKPIEIDDSRYLKSDFYAIAAWHNFHMYQQEMNKVRNLIAAGDGELLDYVADLARNNVSKIKLGLQRALQRNPDLANELQEHGFNDLIPYRQRTLNTNVPIESTEGQTISLEFTPSDFDITQHMYKPNGSILLFIPCSQTKPYSESRTHSVVYNVLKDYWDHIEKVTISGLYGPVPLKFETEEPIRRYEYVLTNAENNQRELVTNRTIEFLENHGNSFDAIIGYAASKTYRDAIADSFDEYDGPTTLLPKDPPVARLTEHFRETHLNELSEKVESILSDSVMSNK